MSNYITLFYMDVITYQCLNLDAALANLCWYKELCYAVQIATILNIKFKAAYTIYLHQLQDIPLFYLKTWLVWIWQIGSKLLPKLMIIRML